MNVEDIKDIIIFKSKGYLLRMSFKLGIVLGFVIYFFFI